LKDHLVYQKASFGRSTGTVAPLFIDRIPTLTEATNFWNGAIGFFVGTGTTAALHCLRHTFITNLGRAKVSPKTAQTLARHSDISLTMNIYSHVSEEDQIEAINALPGIPGTEKPKDDEDENGACVPA